MGRKYNLNTKFWIAVFLIPSLLVFLIFYLLPIITVFVTSFSTWNGYSAPTFVGLKNYIELFNRSEFIISLKNLFWWCILAAVVHVGFAVTIAFILYNKPKGWKFVRSVYMVPNVISMAAWSIMYTFIFNNQYGIVNNFIRIFDPNFNVKWFQSSPWAFWAITFTWLFYGVIVTLIVLSDLLAIPKELHESAYIDGATNFDINFKINLPLCKYSIGTGVILALTSRVSMYENILLTTGGGPGDDTMNLPIMLANSVTDMRYGFANAVAVVMIIIGIVIMVLVNRAFKMNETYY